MIVSTRGAPTEQDLTAGNCFCIAPGGSKFVSSVWVQNVKSIFLLMCTIGSLLGSSDYCRVQMMRILGHLQRPRSSKLLETGCRAVVMGSSENAFHEEGDNVCRVLLSGGRVFLAGIS